MVDAGGIPVPLELGCDLIASRPDKRGIRQRAAWG
jgi:hypothetical protein